MPRGPSVSPARNCWTNGVRLLLETVDEDGEPLSDRFLLDTMAGLLIAGFETTATALGWAATFLTRHPAVLDRLTETALAGDESYAEAIMRETLRLRPPGVFSFRGVVAPFTFDDGFTVPEGSIFALMLAPLMRDPAIYDDPEAFRPERFLDERPGTYTWVPFGGGSRRCLGGAFSMSETRVILSTIARHVRFRPATTPVESMGRASIILIPKDNGMVTLDPLEAPRRSAASAAPVGATA